MCRIKRKYGALLQKNLRHRIQYPLSGAASFSIMLLRIGNVGILSHMEGMNTIMPAVVAAIVMDAAACHNRNVCSLFHIKIIVYHIRDTGSGYHYRNMHLLPLCLTADIHVNPLLILFPADFDMLRITMAKRLSVIAQVESALLLKAKVIYFA